MKRLIKKSILTMSKAIFLLLITSINAKAPVVYSTSYTLTPPYCETDIEVGHQGIAFSHLTLEGRGGAAAIGDPSMTHYTTCPGVCNKHATFTAAHGYKSMGYVAVKSGVVTARGGKEVRASANIRIGNLTYWGISSQVRMHIEIIDLNTKQSFGESTIVTKIGTYTPVVKMDVIKGHSYQAKITVCAEIIDPTTGSKAKFAAVYPLSIRSITISIR